MTRPVWRLPRLYTGIFATIAWLLLGVALSLVWGQAEAAITAASLGTPQNSASVAVTSLTISATADIPAGSLIFAAFEIDGGNSARACADSAGSNTYTVAAFTNIAPVNMAICYSPNSAELPYGTDAGGAISGANGVLTVGASLSGKVAKGQVVTGSGVTQPCAIGTNISGSGSLSTWNVTGCSTVTAEALVYASTLTVSWTSSRFAAMAAGYASGVATTSPVDVAGAGFNNSGTAATTSTPGIATGTLASSGELVVGFSATLGTFGTWSAGSGFTNLGNSPNTSSIALDYDVPASTSATYLPTWTNSKAFVVNFVAFKMAGGAAAKPCNNATTGSGVC